MCQFQSQPCQCLAPGHKIDLSLSFSRIAGDLDVWLLPFSSTITSCLLLANQANLCSGQTLLTSAEFPTPTHNPGDIPYERFTSILFAATHIKPGICRIQSGPRFHPLHVGNDKTSLSMMSAISQQLYTDVELELSPKKDLKWLKLPLTLLPCMQTSLETWPKKSNCQSWAMGAGMSHQGQEEGRKVPLSSGWSFTVLSLKPAHLPGSLLQPQHFCLVLESTTPFCQLMSLSCGLQLWQKQQALEMTSFLEHSFNPHHFKKICFWHGIACSEIRAAMKTCTATQGWVILMQAFWPRPTHNAITC